MRGLPFPPPAPFDRESTSELGTPFSNVDDIPIDPALAGTPAADSPFWRDPDDPSHVPTKLQPVVPQEDVALARPRQYSQEPSQYDQGPRGDPFAPQPAATYLPVPQVAHPRPKPQKKKRKPRREEECGFCQGNDSKNKQGEPELMVSCEECGRSGHPSCMQLGGVANVRSYPWRCIECKICEICQEKGDDERILFCDFCDRGWHMDCLQPPLDKAPPGQWHCPRCPPIELVQPRPDVPLAPPDASPQDGTPYSIEHGPDGVPLEGEGEVEVDVEVEADSESNADETDENDSPTDSSNSDSDSDEDTMGAPTPRRADVKSKKKRPKRKSEASRPPKRMRLTVRSPPPALVVRLRIPPKGKGKEREEDTEKNIFDDLLTPTERDTSKTGIDSGDRTRFDRSRQTADEKLAPPPPPPPSATDVAESPVAGPSSRPLRSHTLHQISIPTMIPTPSPVPSTPGIQPTTRYNPQSPSTPATSDGHPPTLRIRTIRFGRYDIHPWYDAPFPEEYANIPDGRLWICEFCLKYMRSGFAFSRHRLKCKARHPPGDEIYRDGTVSIFEVDGRKNKIYCQNLCLLSKMFLDHKSLFYDVEPFLFYVMAEFDDVGARFLGYFSKEKCSPKDYNVSCIMTLPVRQRQGWGSFLIDFSYLLSKKEQRAGSPEKPLSALGALGYKNYWTLALMRYLKTAPLRPTLKGIIHSYRQTDISNATSMTLEDVYNTLDQLNMISLQPASPPPMRPSPGQSIKFPRGRKNGIARRHLQRSNTQKSEQGGNKPGSPFVPPSHYEILWDQETVEQWLDNWEKKGYLRIKPEKLKWTPFLLTRTKATGELLQSEAGFGIGALSGIAETPAPLLENGTPATADGSDQEKSSVPSPGEGAKESKAANGDTLTTPSAERLFDDELVDTVTTPKKQLRSRNKEGGTPRPTDVPVRLSREKTDDSHPPPLRHTRSSLRLVIDEGAQELEAVAQNAAEFVPNGNHEEELPIAPAKRRRGRPKKSICLSAIHRAKSPSPLPLSSPLLSPRKRRKIDIHDQMASEPLEEGMHYQVDESPLHPRDPLLNGQNGVLRHSSPPLQQPTPDAEMKRPNGVVVVGSHSDARNGMEHLALKPEDIGTPLTGSTSQHSAPSDKTLIVAEEVNGAGLHDKVQQHVMLPRLTEQCYYAQQVGSGYGVYDQMEVHDSDLDAEGDTDDEACM
ncbi:hypothetical protein ID866_6623 [Astraeus odoratus]|nr:hypothetical protein ID866_6623 [Astraeus odoratus]